MGDYADLRLVLNNSFMSIICNLMSLMAYMNFINPLNSILVVLALWIGGGVQVIRSAFQKVNTLSGLGIIVFLAFENYPFIIR